MRGLGLSFSDYVKVGAILSLAVGLMWAFLIRPYSYDWQPSGEINGQVKTLMSNSKVISAPTINAIVTLEGGGQVVVPVPLQSDIRAGSHVVLGIQTDADNPKRKRYELVRAK